MSRPKRPVLAREIAIQALYQYDISQRGSAPMQGIRDLETFVRDATQDLEVRHRALVLVDGTLSSLEELDRLVRRAASHWKLERLAAIDRAILRVALFELLEMDDVPPKVAIHEAIELAKRFSTAESGAFVNGILDRVWRDVAGARDASAQDESPAEGESGGEGGEPEPETTGRGPEGSSRDSSAPDAAETPPARETGESATRAAQGDGHSFENGHGHAEEVVRKEEGR